MEDSAADDASSPGAHQHNCGADCGHGAGHEHEHEHREMDDDEEHSKYVASWQERPDDPENTWSAFPAPPSALYDPQYHPARLLWDRSSRGRPHRRPPLPYSLGFTPKDVRVQTCMRSLCD